MQTLLISSIQLYKENRVKLIHISHLYNDYINEAATLFLMLLDK